MDRIYLDYNATAPLRDSAKDAMLEALDLPHNASSVHSFGREARKLVEHARSHVASLLNAAANQVIFNSGATEGNNTVLKHFSDGRVLISAIEHPACLQVLDHYETIRVTEDGLIDLNHLEELLKQEPRADLVSVMAVNNETGIIQPVKEIAAIAHKYGALFHCDAAQAAGRIPFDIAALGIDFTTLSSHKIGGPQGVGALILGLCGQTPTLLYGGGQEKSARAGTENVAGIAGFGAAAQDALDALDEYQELSTLRDTLEANLSNHSPELIFYGQEQERVANTCLFAMPGTTAETLLMALDIEGIAVSNGSACSSGRVEPSHVLKAMGASDQGAKEAIRLSLGWGTTQKEIDRFIEVWNKIYQRLKEKRT